jgi:GNAT superfamily N-acetyltransferase
MSNTNIWSTNGEALTPRGEVSSGPDSKGLEWKDKLRDGTSILIRTIRGEDADLERRFIEELSPPMRRFRFLGTLHEPSAAFVEQLTHPDRNDLALVALIADGSTKREIGVARFSSNRNETQCECAVAVSDAWQNKGVATLLMGHLIDVARRRGIKRMYSIDAADNFAMRDLAEHLGFVRKPDPDDTTQVLHTLELKARAA